MRMALAANKAQDFPRRFPLIITSPLLHRRPSSASLLLVKLLQTRKAIFLTQDSWSMGDGGETEQVPQIDQLLII